MAFPYILRSSSHFFLQMSPSKTSLWLFPSQAWHHLWHLSHCKKKKKKVSLPPATGTVTRASTTQCFSWTAVNSCWTQSWTAGWTLPYIALWVALGTVSCTTETLLGWPSLHGLCFLFLILEQKEWDNILLEASLSFALSQRSIM